MSRFYVGQPVVCVNDKFRGTWWLHHGHHTRRPVKGQKYHVRGHVNAPPLGRCAHFIVLAEIRNGLALYVGDDVRREVSFGEFRFEPVTESQIQAIIAIATDIPDEIAREMENEDA